jgi:hypothetical protein
MALEEQLLTTSLVNTFQEARAALQKLYDLAPRSLQEAEESSEEYDQAIYFLAYYVEKSVPRCGHSCRTA